MKTNNRRSFLKKTAHYTLAASMLPNVVFAKPFRAVTTTKLPFKLCLNPGNIGVRAGQKEVLELAHKYGFEAITMNPGEIAKWSEGELNDFLGKMKAYGISWESANLPVQFRNDETTFQTDLAALPAVAKTMQRAGGTRMNTWIMPTHSERTYLENFKVHQQRLQAAANIIGHHGIRLGLEYVGPKTLMAQDKFSFIRTMKECKELIHAIGESNVGFVLDSFHWYCAEETAADILTLDKEDIVTCDLNDARSGFTVDTQTDGKRELPMATGVIDVKSFLSALAQLGYDGPVRAEPFNAALNEMDDEAAVKATAEAMKKAFATVQ